MTFNDNPSVEELAKLPGFNSMTTLSAKRKF
jgi:hypothetical protein